jgi:VIT1/CCC1 family predicted Fe2+/Mn2+ transporter
MGRIRHRPEPHLIERIGWLRAAALGANDGIVSTARMFVGVAASAASPHAILIAGVSGLVAGAMSMAAGEYVSVSSQSDAEQAGSSRERKELIENSVSELEEPAEIHVGRGLSRDLAFQVASQLMTKDALGSNARDELGISEIMTTRPFQAAATSAVTFAIGAAMPLLVALLSPASAAVWFVLVAASAFLAALGATGARLGEAKIATATARVTSRGALAIAVTACVGALSGAMAI